MRDKWGYVWKRGSRPALVLIAHFLGSAALFTLLLDSGTPPEEKALLEATRSKAALSAFVSSQPHVARRLVERLVRETLHQHSDERLALAQPIAATIEEQFSDPTLSKSIEHVRRLSVADRTVIFEADRALGRAQAAFDRGAFGEAETGASALVSLYRDLGESPGELKARNLLGNALWASGRSENARAVFRDLHSLAEKRRDPERLASAIGNLASLDLEAGRIREAESAYRRVERMGQAHGLPRSRAFALLYLGNIGHRLGLPERAAPLFEASQKIFAALGERTLEAAAALNRGASLQRLGLSAEALSSYRRALTLHSATGSTRGRARALLNVAEILADAGDVEGATYALSELMPIVRESPGAEMKRFHWGALVTWGDLDRRRGALERARRSYEEAFAIASAAGGPLEIAETRWRLAALSDGERAREELQKAVELLDTMRTRPESEEERWRFVASRRHVYEDLAEIHLRRSDVAAAFSALETFRSRAFLDLLQGGGAVDPDPSEGPRVVLASAAKPEPLSRVMAALSEDALVLHYTVASNWIAILAVGPDGIAFSRIQSVALDPRDVETLGRVLLDPVAPLLRRSRTLFIVPDGALFSVPWPALSWGIERRLLVETHEIAIEPSAAALVTLTRSSKRSIGAPLVVANPTLEEARAEAAALARLLPRSRLLMAESESIVKRELARRSLVHFATHARVDSKRPLSSALLLEDTPEALAASRLAPIQSGDGLLTGYEVLDLTLAPGALVTLAACETMRDAAGEGIAGLARAFFHAGAGTVVASLWPVDDRATRELMIRFYTGLSSGDSRARALSRAQASLARGDAGERLREPYYWAGFILLGDPR